LENAANVFTAKQSFFGVNHAGLCLNSLTTAEYNALTPANGDLFRDSTADRIDARLARGTVELIDSAGGQTVGSLAVTNLLDLRKSGTANLIQFATNNFLRTDTSQLSLFSAGLNRSTISLFRNENFVIGSGTLIAACNNLDSTAGSVDATISRNAAGVWQMGTTSANALGSLNLTNLTASGTLRVGGGTVVSNILSATATLDFPSISSNHTETLTITVTGAVAGDSVFLGVPAGLDAGLIFCASVTAANTVTVRMHNSSGGSIDPASGTFRATVIRF
jgi:hypothetical protein